MNKTRAYIGMCPATTMCTLPLSGLSAQKQRGDRGAVDSLSFGKTQLQKNIMSRVWAVLLSFYV